MLRFPINLAFVLLFSCTCLGSGSAFAFLPDEVSVSVKQLLVVAEGALLSLRTLFSLLDVPTQHVLLRLSRLRQLFSLCSGLALRFGLRLSTRRSSSCWFWRRRGSLFYFLVSLEDFWLV